MKKILLFSCFLFLTGCAHYQELNRMAIITTIGIDVNEDNYSVTLKETVPRKEENKISYEYKYYQATEKTLKQAVAKACQNSSKDIYLKQVQNIIVTKPKIIEKIPHSYRSSIVLFQTKHLKKVLKTNSNYQYLNNLAKEKTTTLKDYWKGKKKIPYVKVYHDELLITN